MYIIEKIISIYSKIKNKEQKQIITNFEDNYILEDIVTCQHHFLPIDSTKQIFACSKCGFVVPKTRLRKKKSS